MTLIVVMPFYPLWNMGIVVQDGSLLRILILYQIPENVWILHSTTIANYTVGHRFRIRLQQ